MALHRDWHETQEGRGRQFWDEAPRVSLDQIARVVAALSAVPPVWARSEFVAELRAQLLAEAASESSEGADVPIHSTAGVRRWEQQPQ